MTATGYIPREFFNLWYELFKGSGGRLLDNPVECANKVYVHYSFDDIYNANNFDRSYYSLIKPINETRRGFWKRIKIKLGL